MYRKNINITRNFFYNGRKHSLIFKYMDFNDFDEKKVYEGSIFLRRKKHEPDFDYCISFDYYNVDDNCSMSNGFNVVDGDIDDIKYLIAALEFMESIKISTPEINLIKEGLNSILSLYL